MVVNGYSIKYLQLFKFEFYLELFMFLICA